MFKYIVSYSCCSSHLPQYGSWYTSHAATQALDVAFELSVSTINMSGTAFSDTEPASEMLKEMAISPFSEAAKAMRIILTRSPGHFTALHAISSLGCKFKTFLSCPGNLSISDTLTQSISGAWETTYIACNRGMLTIEDREEICKGVCSVVASFPKSQREKPYHAFALPVVECLHAMTKEADSAKLTSDGKIAAIIPRLADEVRLLSTMVKSFTAAVHKNSKQMHFGQNGSDESALQPSVGLLKKLWPCLSHIATNYTADKVSSLLGHPGQQNDECANFVSFFSIFLSHWVTY